MNLGTIAGVVLDMDGVLWRGEMALPGLGDLFDMLRKRALPFVLATNNSAKTQVDYVAKLARMQVYNVPETQIVTAGTVTINYLEAHYPAGTPVYVIGGPGLKQVISEAGYVLTDEDVQVVVVGIDFELTYEKLKRASMLIHAGADFIGTNPDLTFPVPEGLSPGAGSILAAIQAATNCAPQVMGKPFAPMYEMALRILGTAPENTLMVGDRLETDVLGAQQLGLKTALVMTGITTADELAESDIQPDGVYQGLPELIGAFDR